MTTGSEAREITFRYRNWRGDVATRRVLPQRIWFGESKWHSGSQWFLEAIDVEKGEPRDFALIDITFMPG
jgi:predicted DNA-binding transcriptional regulator YafY